MWQNITSEFYHSYRSKTARKNVITGIAFAIADATVAEVYLIPMLDIFKLIVNLNSK